jgi:peptide/nickel transport system permease protein
MRKVPIYAILLFLLVFISFFGAFFWYIDPFLFDKNAILLPPSMSHPFGTDRLGRDLFARIIEGGQTSLLIGFISAALSTTIGLGIGLIAGSMRGLIDKLSVFVIDIFLTVPTFFLLLALISYLDANALVLILIISITSWMGTARLIRSETFAVTSKPYIKILRIAGISKTKILIKYYTPLLAPIALMSFSLGVGGAILSESGLSFLGLGVSAPDISWGGVLSEGKDVMDIAWWVSFFPGFMIFLTTYSLAMWSNDLQNKINKRDVVS